MSDERRLDEIVSRAWKKQREGAVDQDTEDLLWLVSLVAKLETQLELAQKNVIFE